MHACLIIIYSNCQIVFDNDHAIVYAYWHTFKGLKSTLMHAMSF